MDVENKSNQNNHILTTDATVSNLIENRIDIQNLSKFQVINKSLHGDLTHTIWGANFKEDVFERWSQGFLFSKKEKTALVQIHGGPCAVIAPVQAYLLKDLLFTNAIDDWRSIKGEDF